MSDALKFNDIFDWYVAEYDYICAVNNYGSKPIRWL